MNTGMTYPSMPLTPQQVADIYGLSVSSVRKAIRNGELPARHKNGGQRKWYITTSDLEVWVTKGMWQPKDNNNQSVKKIECLI